MNTDNLFRLNPLLLRLHGQKVSNRNITNIKSGWDLLCHQVKQPPNIFYMFLC